MWALGQNGGLWTTFDCKDDDIERQRWALMSDGRIEIEGSGAPARAWPKEVNQWADLIAKAAAKHKVPAYWIAAIMALETRGKPGLCAKKADGSCNTREGIGLMAMLTSTASGVAGRPVGVNELLHDYDLQIDLGAKLIAILHDEYNGDFVPVAVGYNAGSVKCATTTSGNTWNLPKEPCPPTPWGVIMGCMRTSKKVNAYCGPSAVEPGKYVCPTDYPRVAIAMHNAALAEGWTGYYLGVPKDFPPGTEPPPLPHETPPAVTGLGAVLPFVAAGVVGYFGATFLYGGFKQRGLL
jgi:hypothetical protein